MAAKPIPDGYEGVTPYLIVDGASRAIDFYKKAFGATELFRMPMGDKIGHAELKIGKSVVMMADEHPDMGHKGPKAYGGTPVSLMFYVEDVDSVFKNAIASGAKEVKGVADQFYGDRSGTLSDPFGHVWTIATHKEDVAPEEMNRRMDAMMKQHKTSM
jgi:PhnB protein